MTTHRPPSRGDDGWSAVEGLNPGDYAYITKWEHNKAIKGRLIYIVSAGPGGHRDFFVVGDIRGREPHRIGGLSCTFFTPANLSVLEKVAAQAWLAEHEIETVTVAWGSKNPVEA